MRREPLVSCSWSVSLYHVMVGVGEPVTEQVKVTVAAGATVELLGCEVNCGDVTTE